MPIRFHCPKCHIRLSVAERKAGHSSPCPNCRQVITIPAEVPPPLPSATLETSAAAAKPEPSPGTFQTRSATSDSSEFVDSLAPQPQAAVASQQPTASNETWQSETAIYDVPPRPPPSPMASDGTTTALPNTISLPRWTVYFQGGLLAVVATAFFLLGMMIDQNSGGTAERSTEMYDCQLTGNVVFALGATKVPDEGAVVIVVPKEGSLQDRDQDPSGLRPEEFDAIDNPSIAQIEAIGGSVARVDRKGEFDLTMRGPREYYVLIISRKSERAAEAEIPTSTREHLSGYFFAPDVIGSKKFYLTTVVLNRRSQNLPAVEF